MNGVSSGGNSSVFDSIFGGIAKIGTAAAAGLGAWAGIKQRKFDMQLQQAQVNAEIARINADKSAALNAAQPLPASALTPSKSGLLASIPQWMLAAGAIAAFFAIRGAVK